MNESIILNRIARFDAVSAIRQARIREARHLKVLGLSNRTLSSIMGLRESAVRHLLKAKENTNE